MAKKAVSFASVGDNTVVTGVAGKRVHVTKLSLVFGGAASVTIKSGSTALTGVFPITGAGASAEYEKQSLDGSPDVFVTKFGDGFIINLSAGVQVSGYIHYFVR